MAEWWNGMFWWMGCRSSVKSLTTFRYHPTGSTSCISPRASIASAGGRVRVFLKSSAPLELTSFVCW
jgi:hypothetical protein